MSARFLPYYVTKYHNSFAVYKWVDETKRQGNKQEIFPDYETAKTRAYELNGKYLKQLKFNCK